MAMLRLKDRSRIPSGSRLKSLTWQVRTGSHTGSIVRQFSGNPNSRAVATNVTGLVKDANLDVTAAGLSFPLFVTLTATDGDDRQFTWQGVVKPITFLRDYLGFYMRDSGGFYMGVPT